MRKPHTVTALLNRMQSAGLISRIIDRENKKVVRVLMTPKGTEALKKVLRVQVERKMMVFLSSEEFQQMRGILEKLRDAALNELEVGVP